MKFMKNPLHFLMIIFLTGFVQSSFSTPFSAINHNLSTANILGTINNLSTANNLSTINQNKAVDSSHQEIDFINDFINDFTKIENHIDLLINYLILIETIDEAGLLESVQAHLKQSQKNKTSKQISYHEEPFESTIDALYDVAGKHKAKIILGKFHERIQSFSKYEILKSYYIVSKIISDLFK